MSSSAAPAHWRRMKDRYRLLGSKCETCQTTFFPSTTVCPNCRRKGKIAPLEFSGRGRVFSYTVIRTAPKMLEQFTPYALALVQLDEGPKVLSQIVDCEFDQLKIGMEVEACFRKLFEQDEGGIISYGFKFRPVDVSWKEYYVRQRSLRRSRRPPPGATRPSRDEAARELKNDENSDWVTKQLKKALDPKDRDTVEV